MLAVSVALATYNGAAHVAAQVQSILRQTVPVDELVLADDGSEDGTVDIVLATVPGDGPRLVIAGGTAPRSVAGNFERALRATRHDVVLLSDQDDTWLPDRVARTLDAFTRAPAALALHGDARLVDESGAHLGGLFDALEVAPSTVADIREGRAFGHLLRRNVATGATMALRRELLGLALPIPPGWIHDEWLAVVAAAVGRLTVIDAPLIEYRQHDGNEIGARRLGPIGKARRLLEPGGVRNARLLARATSLADRLASLEGVPDEYVDAAEAKLAHEAVRSGLPPARWRRLRAVRRELATGRYDDFGRGRLDALRDVFQPLDDAPVGRPGPRG